MKIIALKIIGGLVALSCLIPVCAAEEGKTATPRDASTVAGPYGC